MLDSKKTALLLVLAIAGVCCSDFSQATPVITRCDILVSHPSDPDRVTEGVSSSAVNHDEAIAACELAVNEDPQNARLNYLLGRVFFYNGQTAKALPHLEFAAHAGYRQAQFVLGYILDGGLQGAPDDVCRTEKLWLASARNGRLASLVSYARHFLSDRFGRCDVSADIVEVTSFLLQAKEQPLDYYQKLLVGDLLAAAKSRVTE